MFNSEASKWAIFALALTLQSLLYSYLICNSNEQPVFSPQYFPINTLPTIKLDRLVASKPKILLWTRMWFVFGKAGYYLDNDTSWKDCPYSCDIVDDKNELNEADALIFHARDLEGNTTERIPKRTQKSQLYIFFTMESPVYLSNWDFVPKNVFNWTLTYRADSDIQEPFGMLESKKYSNPYNYEIHSKTTTAYKNYKFNPKMLHKYKQRYLRGKEKLVAWIATRCITKGQRENIVAQLQEFIPISIYGDCGNFTCQSSRKKNPYDCYSEIGPIYKFYLSFENSLCVDYVSEKFYRALDNQMVPIVYGNVNYSQLAPPGSFIDVREFGSIRKLAQYIEYLNLHPEEYLKYFLWREKYRVVHRIKFCNLCQRLWHHSTIDYSSGKRIMDPQYEKPNEDIHDWWLHRNEYYSNGSKAPACHSPTNQYLVTQKATTPHTTT